MVYKSLINLFKTKYTIPFATLSSSFLFGINVVEARTLNQSVDGPNNIKNPFSIFSLSESNVFAQTKDFYDKTQHFFEQLDAIMEWFKLLPVHITQWSIDLLTWVYEIISTLILKTPLWLFKNTWFSDTSLVFSSISIVVIILLTSVESLKQILNRKHVDFSKILKRLPIALIGAGSAPFLFVKTFEILNKVSESITKIGASEIRSANVMNAVKLSGIDTAALIGFDIILIINLVPLIMQTGRRWFDLVTLGVLTPMALTCFIFDNYRNYFHMWWSNIKSLSLIQIVYATFICVMGIFIFGTRNIIDGYGFYMKLLIIIGGLWRMSSMPSFVTRLGDSGKDVTHIYKDLKNVFGKKAMAPYHMGKKLINQFKAKPKGEDKN